MSPSLIPRDMLHRRCLPLEPPSAPRAYQHMRKSRLAGMRSIARRSLQSWRRNRTVTLDDLPFEVLHDIFAYACTDGGPTACSLSLVSKRIHAASRVTHFTSISLLSGSLEGLHKFLDHFTRASEMALVPGCQIPKVRHLCLVVDPMTPDCFELLDYRDQTALERERLDQMREEKQSKTEDEWAAFAIELEREYHRAVGKLLSAVGADLETLCLFPLKKHAFSPGGRCRLRVAGPGFPKLRELWCGYNLTFTPWSSAHRRLVTPFPALTRLHLFDPAAADLTNWWSGAAPQLESYRITLSPVKFEWPNDDLLVALQWSLLEARWPLCEPVHIMSPGPYYWDDWSKPFYSWHAARFRKELYDAGSRVVFVPYYAFQDVVSRDVKPDQSHPAGLARQDWLARISVGVGTEQDGVYARNFWVPHDGEQIDRAQAGRSSVMKFMHRATRANHPVMPLIRWQRGPRYLPGRPSAIQT